MNPLIAFMDNRSTKTEEIIDSFVHSALITRYRVCRNNHCISRHDLNLTVITASHSGETAQRFALRSSGNHHNFVSRQRVDALNIN